MHGSIGGMRRSVVWVLCLTAAILLVRNLHTIFMVLPDEESQGMIYRILYFHIPAWWNSFDHRQLKYGF